LAEEFPTQAGEHALYSQLADYYDRFYWWKDYNKEIDFLVKAFDRHGVEVRDVLEVACGTGSHTSLLADRGYRVTGVDISGDVLRVARKKLEGRAAFIRGDMRDLDAAVPGKSYDAVICLFSSISYNTTAADLGRTVRGMYDHVRPGGFVGFDTHFTRSGFMDGYRGEDIFDDGKVMGARLSVSKRRRDIGEIIFSYLISDGPRTIVLRNDVHRLGLFDRTHLLRAMREAGLVGSKSYDGWTFESKDENDQFSDIIFAGRRPQVD
jgi:SAM-dependent methyltransferase